MTTLERPSTDGRGRLHRLRPRSRRAAVSLRLVRADGAAASVVAVADIGTPAVVDNLGSGEVRVDAPVNPAPGRVSVQSSAGAASRTWR
jgi:hypothetical protein